MVELYNAYKNMIITWHPFEFTPEEVQDIAARDVSQIRREPLQFLKSIKDYLQDEASDEEAAELRSLIVKIILWEDDSEDLPF